MNILHNTNDMAAVVEADKQHIWHHMMQHKQLEKTDPRVMVEAKGIRVTDAHGKTYIDSTSGGVWVVNVGFGREAIANVVRDQLVKMTYFSGVNGTVPGAQFAQLLLEKMPGMNRVYYCNSGSEANEKVFKMVRQISHRHRGGKKSKILYRERDYHGTTITTLSACGQPQRMGQYGPFTPGFVEVPHCLEYRRYGDPDQAFGEVAAQAIEDVILREGPDTIGAMCLEPLTAGGGVIVPPEGYWERVQELCRKYEIYLHIDEVVCGLGRTGKWFGYEHFGLKPDFVTLGKGVASGYAAVACTVTTEEIFAYFKDDQEDPMSYFRDVSTYGGCAAGLSAAIETMRITQEEDLINNCARQGERLQGNLQELATRHQVIGDVRGKGLFQGAELVADRQTREPVPEKMVQAVVADCARQGVLIGSTTRSFPKLNTTLCFAPGLIATDDDIDAITAAVDVALSRVFTN